MYVSSDEGDVVGIGGGSMGDSLCVLLKSWWLWWCSRCDGFDRLRDRDACSRTTSKRVKLCG